jgi:hypothetical protein
MNPSRPQPTLRHQALQLLRPVHPDDSRWRALWQPGVLALSCVALLFFSVLASLSAGLLVICGALILAILQQVFGMELSLLGAAQG